MSLEVTCHSCGEKMTLSVKPRDEWTPNPNRWPKVNTDEWVCPNGHRRDVTDREWHWYQ